eukprot:7723529-Ditylum_brightwellii.AAC.1
MAFFCICSSSCAVTICREWVPCLLYCSKFCCTGVFTCPSLADSLHFCTLGQWLGLFHLTMMWEKRLGQRWNFSGQVSVLAVMYTEGLSGNTGAL